MQFTNNSILSRHYLEYLETMNLNGDLLSQNLSDTEIKNLYDPKYKLSEFDIYKYIVALEYINDSLGCDKYNLTEGITKDKSKYNNILIDLFYHNISQKLINNYPISVVFGIKQSGRKISDLTRADIRHIRCSFDIEAPECDHMNYFHQELQLYRSTFSNYAGNSYTYYVFKQLIKLFLNEVYLYEYKGNTFTHKELVDYFNFNVINHPEPFTLRSISECFESGEIVKVKYQCIKILEPCDINYFPLAHLKVFLIDVNKSSNFLASYDSLIEKDFSDFWDYDLVDLNTEFMENLDKKNLRIDSN